MELTLQKEREHINEEAFVSGVQTAWLWSVDLYSVKSLSVELKLYDCDQLVCKAKSLSANLKLIGCDQLIYIV